MKMPIMILLMLFVSQARAAIRVVSARDDDAGDAKPVALEFTGPGGRLIKRVSLEPETADVLLGARDAYDARLSASGKVLVLTHWRRDPWQRNPYVVRRSLTTRVSWYGQDGSLLGQRDFPARTQVMAVSRQGNLTVLVDAGFEAKDFAVFNDVTGIRSIDDLSKDRELIDHRIIAARPSGELVLSRVIKGPEVTPHHVVISPSGRWFLYRLDRPDVYIDDAVTGKEDCYAGALLLDWRVDDQGRVYGYQPRPSGGLIMYVRKLGASQAVPVETASAREP